jgi:plastocyanin
MVTSAENSEGVPVYKRGALFGLLLVALGTIGEGIGYSLSGDPAGALAFGGVTVAVTTVLGALVLRMRGGALAFTVLAVIVGFVFLQGYNFTFEVRHPESFFDFVPSIVSFAGTLAVIASGAVAFRETRRGEVRLAARPAEQTVVGAVVFGLVALTIVSGALTISGRDTVSAEAKAGAISVKMRKTKFSPDQLDVAPGQALRVVADNNDQFLHTFTMDELDVDVTVRPGSEKLIELPALAAGDYDYVCTITGHESMKGTIQVK